MTTGWQPYSSDPPRTAWERLARFGGSHGRGSLVVIALIVAGAFIAGLVTGLRINPEPATVSVTPPPVTETIFVTPTPVPTSRQPTTTPTPTNPPPTPSPATNPPAETILPPTYLRDLDSKQFVKTPQWAWKKSGLLVINGTDYLNSLGYSWNNCDHCDDRVEFKVPSGYTRFQATFGLSDDTRHDNKIDGIEYFQVTCSDGRELLAATRIEYPESVNVDLDITGCARISIRIYEGTSHETAVLGNAVLT